MLNSEEGVASTENDSRVHPAKMEYVNDFLLKPRLESSRDCLKCAIFARERTRHGSCVHPAKTEYVNDFRLKLRPDSGRDCLTCAIFARNAFMTSPEARAKIQP
jgi:hypothetical protein